MLQVQSVSAGYGSIPVLYDIELNVGRDEVVGLVGPNGAGKSTLVRAIAGLLPAKSGRIAIGDADITNTAAHERPGQGVAIVLNDRHLFGPLSVAQNLAIAERHARRTGRQVNFTMEDLKELFPIVRERADSKVEFLSGGQQQMVAIARALLLQPNILVMDEPSAGLAPKIVKEILGVLHHLKSRGLGILLIEQNVGIVADVAERGYVMSLGRLVHEITPGSWTGLLENDALMKAYLGG